MSRQGKGFLLGAFLIGLGGAFAHDFFGFSKATVAAVFVITGFGLLVSMYIVGPRVDPPEDR